MFGRKFLIHASQQKVQEILRWTNKHWQFFFEPEDGLSVYYLVFSFFQDAENFLQLEGQIESHVKSSPVKSRHLSAVSCNCKFIPHDIAITP